MNKKEILQYLKKFRITDTVGDIIRDLNAEEDSKLKEEVERLNANVGKCYYYEDEYFDESTGQKTLSREWYKVAGVTCLTYTNYVMYECDWLSTEGNSISFVTGITLHPDDVEDGKEIPPEKYEEVLSKYNELKEFNP